MYYEYHQYKSELRRKEMKKNIERLGEKVSKMFVE